MKNLVIAAILSVMAVQGVFGSEDMDEMWGQAYVKLRAEDARRGQLFTNGS